MDAQLVIQQILTHTLTLVLGGATVKSYIEKKLPSADKILEREDKARADFLDNLMVQVTELRSLHEQCMRDRLEDSRKVEYMRGQLELLTGSLPLMPKLPLIKVDKAL